MSRRYIRSLLSFSAPLVLASIVLAGCGGGGGGSADLDEGGSTTTPPPPASKVEEFDFTMVTDWFVSGTPPTHAQFVGGSTTETNSGAWIIPSGETGIVYFGTPADSVKFSTKDDFDAAIDVPAAASKSSQPASSKVDPPFDVTLYVRGFPGLVGFQPVNPAAKLVEVADNVLEVTLALNTSVVANGEFEAADEPGEFKIADESGRPRWRRRR